MKSLKIILIIILCSTFLSQTLTQRDSLTADAVLNETKNDLSTCVIDKAKVVAALKIESKYSKKLEDEITLLHTKIKDLESKLKSSN